MDSETNGTMAMSVRSFDGAYMTSTMCIAMSILVGVTGKPARTSSSLIPSVPSRFPSILAIRAPTLLLTGEGSPAFLLRLSDRLEELLPVVECVEIPNASHAMHEENSAAVNEAIIEFLGRAV